MHRIAHTKILSLLAAFVLPLIACSPSPAATRTVPTRSPAPPVVVVKRAPPPLRVTAALDRAHVKAGAPGEVVARLRITTAPDLAVERVPVNLALVVDTSGSMTGTAIDHARKAAKAMVAELRDGDRLAIVVFGSETEVLVPSARIDAESRARIDARIAAVAARGTTDLAGGLSAGIAQLRAGRVPGAINRLVLLSDGNPNDPQPLPSLAALAHQSAITITALGLGLDYNETLLGALARRTGGSFHFIKEPSAVARVFRDEVIRMRQVIAHQLTLRILPGPGVALQRIYGREASHQGRYAYVPLGVMRAGERRDVLVRLSTPAGRPGATLELMDGVLSYVVRSPAGGHTEQHKLYLSVAATDEAAKLAVLPDPSFVQALARAEAAQGTVDAIALARAGRVSEALALLDRALAAARAEAERSKDSDLAAQVAQMVKLRVALPTLAPPSRPAGWHRRVGPGGPRGPGGRGGPGLLGRPGGPRGRGRRGGPGRRRRQPVPVAPIRTPAAAQGTTPSSAAAVRKAHSQATRVLDR